MLMLAARQSRKASNRFDEPANWEEPMKFVQKSVLVAISTVMLSSVAAVADSDVSHNWNAENEVAAMKIFRDKYEELGGTWKETTFPDSEPSISSTKTRIIGGKPPMALQSTLGGVMREFAENGLLQNMDEVATADGWDAKLSPGLPAVAKYDGHYVAAPVFLDVINWMYTNNEVLKASGVDAPETFDDFIASLPVLQEKGYIPIAIGGQSWQEAILFDHIVLGVGGAELYDAIMNGDENAISSAQMLKVFEQMGNLRQYTDEGKSGRSWNDTNTLMVSGQAAYFFMGPWAAGGYTDLGDEGGKWSCRVTPWTNGLTAVADGFQFIAVDGADKEAQALFAQAVMDPATQIAAAKAKGTLPAVKGAKKEDFAGCPSKAVEAMQTRQTVTHWNGHAADIGNAVKDTVTAFWNSDMSAADGHTAFIAAMK